MMCHARLQKAGGALHIVGAQGMVEEALAMTSVNKIVPLYPTTKQAADGFPPRSGDFTPPLQKRTQEPSPKTEGGAPAVRPFTALGCLFFVSSVLCFLRVLRSGFSSAIART
jgi:hypothetical protein